MILDVTFEDSPLDAYLASLQPHQRPSAASVLALCSSEEELDVVLSRGVRPDLSDLPAYADYSCGAQRLAVEAQLHTPEEVTAALGKDDPLSLYLEELAGIPSCGDEHILVSRLPASAQQLMNLSLRAVVDAAFAFTGKGVLLMDLIQEGSMGLWAGLTAYDGGDFAAYRENCICTAMERAVLLQAYAAGVGEKLRRAVEDYRMTDQRLLAELGRNPTAEELAQALHMAADEAAMVAGVLENARNMERVKPAEPEPQEEDQAVEDTAYFQMRQRIQELLSELTEQEAQLLTLRYGLEGGKPMSAAEVAVKLGMTAQQAVAMEANALQKLRKS